jgi:molecular chaperone GrpE
MNGETTDQAADTAQATETALESDINVDQAPAIDPAEAKKHWEQLLRTTADFENFRKRAAREKQDAVKFANESLLQKLIPILDQLDMALAAASPEAASPNVQALQTGVSMTNQQFKKVLADAGLTEIEAVGQPFDPNFHEAVAEQESAEVPEGHVVQQLRRGFKLKDRLLRASMVVVAKAPGR